MFGNKKTAVTVRLPQQGDESLQPKEDDNVSVLSTTVEEKKNSSQSDVIVENKKNIKNNEDDGFESSSKNEIQPPKNIQKEEITLDSDSIKRMESDQEKMILELFDGKYIE